MWRYGEDTAMSQKSKPTGRAPTARKRMRTLAMGIPEAMAHPLRNATKRPGTRHIFPSAGHNRRTGK